MEGWETEELRERVTRIDEELAYLRSLLEGDQLYRLDPPMDIKPTILDDGFKVKLFEHLQRQRAREYEEQQQLKRDYIAQWQVWTKDKDLVDVSDKQEVPAHASILESNRKSEASIPSNQRWMTTLAVPPEQRKPFPIGYKSENGRWLESVQAVGEYPVSQIGLGNVSVDGCVWTVEEQQGFVDRYVQHPKQFHRIASHLPNKSCSDCVLFYYRFKKPLRLKQRAQSYRKTGSSGGNLSSGSSVFEGSGSTGRVRPVRRGRPPKSRQQESTAEEGTTSEEDREREGREATADTPLTETVLAENFTETFLVETREEDLLDTSEI